MMPTREVDDPHTQLSLTRMIYAVSGGIILYLLLVYSWRFLFGRMRDVPWGFSRFDVWYYVSNLCFVAAMLLVAVAYRFRPELFRWESGAGSLGTTGWIRGIALGLLGGAVALLFASPVFWFGWGQTKFESIQLLIANALSPLGVLNLLFFIFALAVSSEIVFRGIVFRTCACYASVPAAALASCLLFAYIFPVVGFLTAIILSVTSSILYYKTRNLLASILANALFTVGGNGITLYHRLK